MKKYIIALAALFYVQGIEASTSREAQMRSRRKTIATASITMGTGLLLYAFLNAQNKKLLERTKTSKKPLLQRLLHDRETQKTAALLIGGTLGIFCGGTMLWQNLKKPAPNRVIGGYADPQEASFEAVTWITPDDVFHAIFNDYKYPIKHCLCFPTLKDKLSEGFSKFTTDIVKNHARYREAIVRIQEKFNVFREEQLAEANRCLEAFNKKFDTNITNLTEPITLEKMDAFSREIKAITTIDKYRQERLESRIKEIVLPIIEGEQFLNELCS